MTHKIFDQSLSIETCFSSNKTQKMIYRLWTVISKFELVITIFLIHQRFLERYLVRCMVTCVVCYWSKLIYFKGIRIFSLARYLIWEMEEAGDFLEFVLVG